MDINVWRVSANFCSDLTLMLHNIAIHILWDISTAAILRLTCIATMLLYHQHIMVVCTIVKFVCVIEAVCYTAAYVYMHSWLIFWFVCKSCGLLFFSCSQYLLLWSVKVNPVRVESSWVHSLLQAMCNMHGADMRQKQIEMLAVRFVCWLCAT